MAGTVRGAGPLPVARRERHALCDTALAVGPDAPTLCGDWDARDLVAHLLVREGSPLGAAGIAVAPLAGLTDRAMARLTREPFPDLVDRLREPGLTPYRIPVVERLANTVEYFVHHEDLRRAQPDWSPRALPAVDEDELWWLLRSVGRLFLRRVGVPVVARRSDRPDQVATLRRGAAPVTLAGRPSELVLLCSGRAQLRDVEVDGPPEAVRRLREAPKGL